MQNDDRQEELERKIAEAVALAQSVVEDNERKLTQKMEIPTVLRQGSDDRTGRRA